MAVHESVNRPFAFDNGDDDDDEPLVFKRSSSASKQNHLSSEPKKPSSSSLHKLGVPSGRQVPSTSTADRQTSNLQKSKLGSTVKASVDKTNVSSTKSHASVSDQSKNSSLQNHSSNDTEKKRLNVPPVKTEDSDDSDDDKPLSSRLTVVAQKNKFSPVAKELKTVRPSSTSSEKMKESLKKPSDDLDDQKPLSSKFPLKHCIGSSAKKEYDSDEDKPLSSRFQQNGSSSRNPTGEVSLKTNKGVIKRSLGHNSSSPQPSSTKKLKVSGIAVPNKAKQETVVKKEVKEEDDDDHVPISQRLKKTAPVNNQSSTKKVINKVNSVSFKKGTKNMKNKGKKSTYSKSLKVPPGSGEGQKWTTLEHNGVIFPPPYKPHGVKMLYNGQPVDLTPEQEEVATMFAVMKDTDYATKPTFIENFMNDWRQILGRNHVIKKFELCDFTPIYEWHMKEKEKKKNMSTEEKKILKEEKLKQEEKYMWAIVDSVKEKVGNFRVEPPGLFRGRGEHPKMGKLKRRIRPSDITINIGRKAPVPECPIPGESWKEVKHDNTVTWLAFWNDPINSREFKYVFLAASSSLKGQSDKEKYEKARLLKNYIHGIRAQYTKDFTNKDITKRQIAVATYLIDKLALRAGNEKDDDEADTVGCCTLKVENVSLLPPNKIQDIIVCFYIQIYELLGKKDGQDLFDRLDTSKLNAHLKELMPGLTAKVFRTYNASITLDEMSHVDIDGILDTAHSPSEIPLTADLLNMETKDSSVAEKITVYQKANKEVAIICNHQRSVSKSHDAQMSRLDEKISDLKAQREDLNVDLGRAKKGKPPLKDAEGKTKRNLSPEVLEKKLCQIDAKIEKLEREKITKEDLKTVALGTSKINYLDPRISVAWCKRHEVPIEKRKGEEKKRLQTLTLLSTLKISESALNVYFNFQPAL
ncbi:DNA topoisomerase 1 [Acorus gramineus]|uniref:DNA topoisomerase n=1 Tax=Acorus gramineus TaxID=55184 RepID=A0AAV9BEM3_ACOGR|nr:DNA topoisomerase 1 [Acorus gramineus]